MSLYSRYVKLFIWIYRGEHDYYYNKEYCWRRG